MKSRMTLTGILAALLCSLTVHGQTSKLPKTGNLSEHAFPALGAAAPRKVQVEWNRFYDHEGLGKILANLHQAYPKLTRLYSIGKSAQGRDLWCLEISAFEKGDSKRKPGMYIDGNIHGNEVQGSEVAAYTAWYLCHQYGYLPKVTDILDHSVFYIVPSVNPDARDHWLKKTGNSGWPRSGFQPKDDDQDGLSDEDDFDDLNRDGSVCQMRIKDPRGRWKPHPDYPDWLMVPCGEDEPGQYTLLGLEGIDNDGDGRINEDPIGGYDMNRDWAWDWQPSYVQNGAMEYPFYNPETRSIAQFFTSHPTIVAAQSYHNALGAILRPPGRDGGSMSYEDDAVFRAIGQRGEKILPHYRSIAIGKDLYTVWGGSSDWVYNARGVIEFVNELWTLKNMDHSTNAVTSETEAAFIKYVMLEDGAVKWHSYEHPTYGTIEIGGFKKNWGRVPPSFLLEEECHRNMAFTLFHADQMPRIAVAEIKTDKLGDNLYRVWITVENKKMIPTRISTDIRNHLNSPDMLTVSGSNIRVISSGFVTDPYFKKVQPSKRHPERLEIPSIPGRGFVRTQFILSGKGKFEVKLDSVKAGVVIASSEIKP